MVCTDNYAQQARQAKQIFLTYQQDTLIRKFCLRYDDTYLYLILLGEQYRLHRGTGDLQRLENRQWADANDHSTVMTLLDLLCDSRNDRYLSGQWQTIQSFGNQIHRNLTEQPRDTVAERFAADPDGFSEACRSLGGTRVPMGDCGWAVELFDGLRIAVAIWLPDEEFAASLRIYLDRNAAMYLRYETMYYAAEMLENRLLSRMTRKTEGETL